MWDGNDAHENAYVVVVNYLHIHFQDVEFNVLRNGTSAKPRKCYFLSNRISSFFIIVMFRERAFWLWQVEEAVVGLEAEFGNNTCLQCAFYILFCNSLGCWQVDTSPQISPVVQVCKVSHLKLQKESTLTIVFSVTDSYFVSFNTSRKPNNICHFFCENILGIMDLQRLQWLSLTKWLFIKISIIHDIISLHNCYDIEYTKFWFHIWHGCHQNFNCPLLYLKTSS